MHNCEVKKIPGRREEKKHKKNKNLEFSFEKFLDYLSATKDPIPEYPAKMMMETDKIMDESIGNSQVIIRFRRECDAGRKTGKVIVLGRFAEPTLIVRYSLAGINGKNR